MIGFKQRVPIGILEMALLSALDGDCTKEAFRAIAALEYTTENRIEKILNMVNRLTYKSPLWPAIEAEGGKMRMALKSKTDRPVAIAAIACGAYPFAYDFLTIAGKYFHTTDEVRGTTIREQLGLIHGANASLQNAYDSVTPFLSDAGFLERPAIGKLRIKRHEHAGEFVRSLYREAFLINNPGHNSDDDVLNHPFFEFLRP